MVAMVLFGIDLGEFLLYDVYSDSDWGAGTGYCGNFARTIVTKKSETLSRAFP